MWTKEEAPDKKPTEEIKFNNKDDGGDGQARFRLNLEYLNADGNIGFKARLQWDNWAHERKGPEWPYAFGFGNFFEDQLTVSVGKLGASPWGTGGPEMWKELEQMDQNVGIRFEYKPYYVSGLNVGFVLNWFDGYMDGRNTDEEPIGLADILMESVLGVSYVHDYFLVRFACRLDSDVDMRGRDGVAGIEGGEIIYRLEERILNNYLEGFQIWALGHIAGIGAESESYYNFRNWMFVQYAPELFTAQLRLGYDTNANRSMLYAKPNFYWNFFNKLIVAGVLFGIGQDFGDGKVNKDAPYSFVELEPKVQINFTRNAYAAFVYNWRREYKQELASGTKPIQQNQWINLRMGITF